LELSSWSSADTNGLLNASHEIEKPDDGGAVADSSSGTSTSASSGASLQAQPHASQGMDDGLAAI
jgi:hypothetical protein